MLACDQIHGVLEMECAIGHHLLVQMTPRIMRSGIGPDTTGNTKANAFCKDMIVEPQAKDNELCHRVISEKKK